MTYEKVIKRDDKSQVKIRVDLYVEMFRDEFRYSTTIYRREYRKKAWHTCEDCVTKEEIHTAKRELWNKLKPQF